MFVVVAVDIVAGVRLSTDNVLWGTVLALSLFPLVHLGSLNWTPPTPTPRPAAAAWLAGEESEIGSF